MFSTHLVTLATVRSIGDGVKSDPRLKVCLKWNRFLSSHKAESKHDITMSHGIVGHAVRSRVTVISMTHPSVHLHGKLALQGLDGSLRSHVTTDRFAIEQA